MYTNPSNIIDTLQKLFKMHEEPISQLVEFYTNKKQSIVIFKGKRKVKPIESMPCLEISPDSASNEWFACRSQRPRFSFRLALTCHVPNLDYCVEYPSTLMSFISELVCNPRYIQLPIENETKWDFNDGLVPSYILDGLIDSISYSDAQEGTIQVQSANWTVTVHEPFPDSMFANGEGTIPDAIRPILDKGT